MKLSADGRERIRLANPIEDVIRDHGVELRRKGKSLMGLCPLHEDHEPSLSVQVEEQRFRCFGRCNEGGDVFRFVQLVRKLDFPAAARWLAARAGLVYEALCEDSRRASSTVRRSSPRPAHSSKAAKTKATESVEPTSSPGDSTSPAPAAAAQASPATPTTTMTPTALLSRAAELYHRALLEIPAAQQYLRGRGLTDTDLWRLFQLGYGDGSLLRLTEHDPALRAELVALGLVSQDGRREFFEGCVVVPIPDPESGAVVTFYGRSIRTKRHLYLRGTLRGVLAYQAARSASEVIVAESVIDALSFHQAGLSTAIPLFGCNGFTSEHLDTLLRSPGRRVVLCLDNDDAGRRATASIAEKLTAAGLAVRVAALPAGVKDPNDLLVGSNGDAADALARVVAAATPWPPPATPQPTLAAAAPPAQLSRETETSPATSAPAAGGPLAITSETSSARPEPQPPANAAPAADDLTAGIRTTTADTVTVAFPLRTYELRSWTAKPSDRLTVVVRAEANTDPPRRFHVDKVDLYAARSRRDYAKSAATALAAPGQRIAPAAIEQELLAVLAHLESHRQETREEKAAPPPKPVPTGRERDEALAFLQRPDLLDQVEQHLDLLGFVGESVNKRLLYLVTVSRLLREPLQVVIVSQSSAGKSSVAAVVERILPPECVVVITRLTPQSLYYVDAAYLDGKVVIIEERQGSEEAEYSVRILQSRGMLRSLVPVKDPATGGIKSREFTVFARAAFVEATTQLGMNHENATRCFELSMDESVEQTRRIHERQRLMKTAAGLELRREADRVAQLHWNAQRLLEPLPVVIPYAEAITFPATSLRTRRDHARFLNLIEGSAFVHQYQRERVSGAVVASAEDYAVAYELARTLLPSTLSDLKGPLRDTYKKVRSLIEAAGDSVSRREIRESLGMADGTLRGWLAELVDLEYLEMEGSRGGAGKCARYRLADQGLAEDALGLRTPVELGERLGR